MGRGRGEGGFASGSGFMRTNSGERKADNAPIRIDVVYFVSCNISFINASPVASVMSCTL